MSWEIRNGLAGWFWLRVSHEVAVKILSRAAVMRELNWDRRFYFQDGSLIWLAVWCQLLEADLSLSLCGLLLRLCECLYDKESRFSQRK